MKKAAIEYLKEDFFQRDSFCVAEELLACWLCRETEEGQLIRSRITEIEIYDGFADRASHAHRGKTARNQVMFGPAGRTYLYLCYGVHWLLNVTTREAGYPAALLIRGVQDCQGPGRLTRYFQLSGTDNDRPLSPDQGIWLAPRSGPYDWRLEKRARVGIDSAGSPWSDLRFRYCATQQSR